MFVCFFNPYNVGDRVRLNDELLIVKKVSTYFSEFVSVPYNKPVCFFSTRAPASARAGELVGELAGELASKLAGGHSFPYTVIM